MVKWKGPLAQAVDMSTPELLERVMSALDFLLEEEVERTIVLKRISFNRSETEELIDRNRKANQGRFDRRRRDFPDEG